MSESESREIAPGTSSWASTPATRASMQSNRGRDTAPEMVVRRRLHAAGLRYRVSVRPITNVRRTADIGFTRVKVAVFIDGCFWHGCPQHYQAPVRNADFWLAKRTRNRERDAETDDLLVAAGWVTLRFWGHEVKTDPELVATTIARTVRSSIA